MYLCFRKQFFNDHEIHVIVVHNENVRAWRLKALAVRLAVTRP